MTLVFGHPAFGFFLEVHAGIDPRVEIDDDPGRGVLADAAVVGVVEEAGGGALEAAMAPRMRVAPTNRRFAAGPAGFGGGRYQAKIGVEGGHAVITNVGARL